MESRSSTDRTNRSSHAFVAQQNALLPNATGDADAIAREMDYETDRDFILENLKTSLRTLDHETARDIIQEYDSVASNDPDFQLLKRHAQKAFAKYGFKSEILLAIEATPLNKFDALEKYYTQLLRFEPENEVWLMSQNAAKHRIIYSPEKPLSPQLKRELHQNTCPVTAEIAARPLPGLLRQTAGRIFSLAISVLNALLAALGIGVIAGTASGHIFMVLLFLATAYCFALSLPSARLKQMELHKASHPRRLSMFFLIQVIILIMIITAFALGV